MFTDQTTLHIVLVGTTNSGNIGAAARAMKTMGLTSLRLVGACDHLSPDAVTRSSGAIDVLEQAEVYQDLSAAIGDCTLVFGTSARSRSLEWSTLDARESAKLAVAGKPGGDVAIVFGRERSGLTNDELSLCDHRLHIPTNPQFSSLNLGSAVQVVSYEIRAAYMAATDADSSDPAAEQESLPKRNQPSVADSESMERFYQHLEQTLIDIEFLDTDNPRILMLRLRRVFGRNRPDSAELNILRGILTAVGKQCQK